MQQQAIAMFGIASALLGSNKPTEMQDNKKRKADNESCEEEVKKAKVVEEKKTEDTEVSSEINYDEQADSNKGTCQGDEENMWGDDDTPETEDTTNHDNKDSEKNKDGNGNGESTSKNAQDEETSTNVEEENGDEEINGEKDEADENVKENPYKKLRFCIVENDGKPDNCVKLIGLKSLFAKQLPKMPRPYIARLVFDRRHTSLAILSDDPQHKGTDEEIIGAICYRGFYEMRFAEIAFCAVNSSHQVKVRDFPTPVCFPCMY